MSYFCAPRVLIADRDERFVFWQLCNWAAWQRTHRTIGKVTFLLERGQAVITGNGLADAVGVGRSVVRRCLAALEARGTISLSARHRAGTVVTINGLGANPNVATTSTPKQPATLPTTRSPTVESAVPVDATDFYEVPMLGQPQEQPQERPPQEELRTKTENKDSTHPPPGCAREGGEGLTDEEADLLVTAQAAFERVASPREALRFVEQLRDARLTAPWLTAERIKRDIAWMAEHPKARAETRCLSRVFFAAQVRKTVATWDAELVRSVTAGLAAGATPEQLAAGLRSSSAEPTLLRAYVLKVAQLCAPPLRAQA